MAGVGALFPGSGQSTPRIIDLRSPAEFADDHLPGAHNVPLFDDEGRAVVGLFYKQLSPDAAFEEARALATRRIHGLVTRICDLAGWDVPEADLQERLVQCTSGGIERLERELTVDPIDRLASNAVVLHCWRGGLRSRSVVAFLRALGFQAAVGLEGGYKSYRKHCLGALEAWSTPPSFALRGLTGVGKTLVLRALCERRPEWVLDLELMAGHRSSLLGMVGLQPCSQKTFETRMFERIRDGFGGAVVMEGESRRVGDAIVPPRAWEALANATNIEITAPLEHRVRVLMDDYLADPAARGDLRCQLAKVEARMERNVPLVEMFEAGREEAVVTELLEHYYDPLYRHSERGKRYASSVDASDPERAAREIEAFVASAAS